MKEDVITSEILKKYNAFTIFKSLKRALENEKVRRQEFYETIDENQKVEFINGEIIMHSPVRLEHNEVTGFIYNLVNNFVRKNKLGFVGIEKILISLTRNDYEPDVCYFKREKSVKFKKGQMQFPAPDLVVEVLSDSTEERDRGVKFYDYAAHKIEEYWIVNPDEKTIEQYHLRKGEYNLVMKSTNGILKSFVLKKFEVPVNAFFQETENAKALLKILSE